MSFEIKGILNFEHLMALCNTVTKHHASHNHLSLLKLFEVKNTLESIDSLTLILLIINGEKASRLKQWFMGVFWAMGSIPFSPPWMYLDPSLQIMFYILQLK